ncbi:hypothetical protein ACFPYI_03880 [Halomarina salina]|uniref:Halobacterial output domain-containing protein n=1 Tax=Halomarina salina TaxID=1872699 RepID=A0ABD5RJ11_9EURY|nr:hypothetical protein [Halomarina salina]
MSESEPDAELDETTTTWPDLGIALYDRLTGRNAVIEYEFDDMNVFVPSRAGEDADHAHWRLDGTLTISTRERDD